MSIISHSNIEKSFYKFINDNLGVPYDYAINYNEIRFETNPYELWLSINIVEIGAGAKKFSPTRIDVITRIADAVFNDQEILAIDRIRERLTNADIDLYDYSVSPPALIPNQKLIIKNSDGRFTVDRIILNTPWEEGLSQNLRKSSVFLRLELLTDTVGGRFV